MTDIRYYTKNRDDENMITLPDHEVTPFILKVIDKKADIKVTQVVFLYVARALIASGRVKVDELNIYIDDVHYEVLPNGRFKKYPAVDDIFESCIDTILRV